MANINSYAENLNKLTESTNEMIKLASALNQVVAGNDASVTVTDNLVLPSFENVIKRVDRVENTIAKFTQGTGTVETNDGTYRKIRVDTVSKPPRNISVLSPSTSFGVDPNWFFESLQYPKCVVRIDLKNQIDDDSDRVYVNRVIVDATQNSVKNNTDVSNTILNGGLSYGSLIEYLVQQNVSYREDKDECKLPLTYEKNYGYFQVIGMGTIKNQTTNINEKWYYLSSINYSTVDENGNIQDSGNVLTIYDNLRYNNSLYTITAIDQTEKRVKLECNTGYDAIGLMESFELYNIPFSEKTINVGIGVDEYDIIYIKGVNESYNLLSKDWSEPLAFYTNTLTFEDEPTKTFIEYYVENVADFGRRWISQIKEGQIPAYGGKTPNAPVLKGDDLRVVQINTQLEATLDSEAYNNITSEIASIKSNITAVRNTISTNKNKLIQESDVNNRTTIQNTINTDTDKLNNLTTQFGSLVDELNTLLNNAGAINYSPKYHIRGFFTIPDPQYLLEASKKGKEEIIGFETMYRYLHTNETGTKLNTFNYTDPSTGVISTGVFTDWNLSVSQFLEKKYNEDTDAYDWVSEKTDGTSISINQIDIPIRSGEKVEIKVRSISEAGYPYNPLKSNWSNSVIISFPSNLTTDDSVTTILETVKSDINANVLQETLSSAGIYTHMADGNAKFKHSTNNIEYNETGVDDNGNSVVTTMSLTDKISSMMQKIEDLKNQINDLK